MSQYKKEDRPNEITQAIPGAHGLQPVLCFIQMGDGKERVNLVSRFPKTRASRMWHRKAQGRSRNTSHMNLPDFNYFVKKFCMQK